MDSKSQWSKYAQEGELSAVDECKEIPLVIKLTTLISAQKDSTEDTTKARSIRQERMTELIAQKIKNPTPSLVTQCLSVNNLVSASILIQRIKLSDIDDKFRTDINTWLVTRKTTIGYYDKIFIMHLAVTFPTNFHYPIEVVTQLVGRKGGRFELMLKEHNLTVDDLRIDIVEN